MPTFTESKIIKQITILPNAPAVQVQWANIVKRDDVVISETFERSSYDANLVGFEVGVGNLDVNAFLAAFIAATLDDKAAADQAAKAALDAEVAAHAATVAELESAQAELVTLREAFAAATSPAGQAEALVEP